MYVFVVLAYLRLPLSTALRRLRLGSRSSLSPGSSTLQQPSDIFVHDERDARAGKHPDEIRRQAAVESYEALVRPSVRDRGRDGAVVRACEHRVVLEELVSCVRASARRTMTMGAGGGGCRRGKGREVVTWMRERTTWYGYVAQSAASFDAPDMSVYAVLDCR